MKYKQGMNPNSRNGFKKGHTPKNKGKMTIYHFNEKPSYRIIHGWLDKWYNQEKIKCEQCKERNKKLEWSLIKGKKHERKRTNYQILCKSCHIKYDNYVKKGWITRQKNNRKSIKKNY